MFPHSCKLPLLQTKDKETYKMNSLHLMNAFVGGSVKQEKIT